MDFNIVIISILWLLTLATILIITFLIIKPYIDKKNEIRDKDIKNKKYELFNDISIEETSKALDDYFEGYVARYITYKFIANKVIYIKDEDIETMIKDITKAIYLEISELYVFYIKMTRAINSDEDLLEYIHSKVTDISISSSSNFNKSNI